MSAQVLMSQALLDAADDVEQLAGERLVADLVPTFLERGDILKREVMRSYVSQVSKGTYPSDGLQQMARWLDDLTGFAFMVADDETISKEGGIGTDRFEAWANRRVKRVGGRFARDTTKATRGPGSFSRPGTKGAKFQGPAESRVAELGLKYEGDVLQPDPAQIGAQPDDTKKQIQQRQAQYLGAMAEAQTLQRELKAAFGDDAKHVNLSMFVADPRQLDVEGAAARVRERQVALEGQLPDFDPQSEMVVGLDAALDVDGETNEVKNRVRQKAMRMQAQMPGLYSRLNEAAVLASAAGPGGPGARYGDTRQRASNLTRAAGQTMSSIGGPLTGIGQAMQAVGEGLGSDAARVIAPYVERAAMRYTGTRTKPSREVEVIMGRGGAGGALDAVTSGKFDDAYGKPRWDEIADKLEEASGTVKDRERGAVSDRGSRALAAGPASEGVSALAYSLRRRSERPEGAYTVPPTRDQVLLGARSDLGALAMSKKLQRDPTVMGLSLQAGRTLPSRGIIVDAKGNVTYEAVGNSDDHYVPFDARMLKDLAGGQYVRTRNYGGPSVEDVRTLLTSNARMATVVTPAGVFELELDPDARGARRYAYQAQAAINSYARILDEVNSGGMFLGELPDGAVKQIEQDAVLRYPDPAQNKERVGYITDAVKRLKISQAVESAGLDFEAEQQAAEDIVRESGGDLAGSEFQDKVREVYEQRLRDRLRPLMLNSEGYDLALRTLAERHPTLFRSVQHRSLRQFYRDLGQSGRPEGVPSSTQGKDKGYVPPGRIRVKDQKDVGVPTPAATATEGAGEQPRSGGEAAGAAGAAPPPGAPQAPAAADAVPDQSPTMRAVELAGEIVAPEAQKAIRSITSASVEFGDPTLWAWILDQQGQPDLLRSLAQLQVDQSHRLQLFDDLRNRPGLRQELLTADDEALVEEIGKYRKVFDPGPDDPGFADADTKFRENAPEAVRQLKRIAAAALLTSPRYAFAKGPAKPGDDPTQPVLTPKMSTFTSITDYDAWSEGADEDATQARIGRDLLSRQTSGDEEEEGAVAALVRGTVDLYERAGTLINRLEMQRGRTAEERGRMIDQALPDLDKDVREQLANPAASDQAGQRLLQSIKLGFSSSLLRQQLEVAFPEEAGGAGPKAQGPLGGLKMSRLLQRPVSKRLLVSKADPRLTTSLLSSRRRSLLRSTA